MSEGWTNELLQAEPGGTCAGKKSSAVRPITSRCAARRASRASGSLGKSSTSTASALVGALARVVEEQQRQIDEMRDALRSKRGCKSTMTDRAVSGRAREGELPPPLVRKLLALDGLQGEPGDHYAVASGRLRGLMRAQGMTNGENYRDLLTRLSTALAMTEAAYLEARRRGDL
jgi:hypothetical protein